MYFSLIHIFFSIQGSLLLAVGISACKLFGIMVAQFLVDRVGRRPILVYGSVCCAISLLFCFFGVLLKVTFLFILGMYTFLFFFGASHATLFGVMVSEVFSMHYKRVAFACTGFFLFSVGAIADFFFLTLINQIHAYTFLIGVTTMIIAALTLSRENILPETKGLELGEIRAKFKKIHLQRKDSSFFDWFFRGRSKGDTTQGDILLDADAQSLADGQLEDDVQSLADVQPSFGTIEENKL